MPNSSGLLVHFLGVDASLEQEIYQVARKNEMPASKVAAMAIRVGLPAVKEYLDGMAIDLDADAWSLTDEGMARMRDKEEL